MSEAGDEARVMADDGRDAIVALRAENARLHAENAVLLEQQTALSEVLRVIASSPSDLQPVLDAVVETVGYLWNVDDVVIYVASEDRFVHAAWRGEVAQAMTQDLALSGRRGPLLTSASVIGQAWRERRQVQVANLAGAADEYPSGAASAQRYGHRTVLATPMLLGGEPVGVICLYRTEIRVFTERQMALLRTFADQAVIAIENARLFEELRTANRALEEASRHKTQFLANMSHELRTPLNAVIGYSEMLQEELEDLGQAELVPDVEKINAAGRHLLGLINDILDLSKIEAGKMELFLETVDVSRLVRDVATTIEPLIGKNGNSLVVDITPEIHEMHADATRLRQILFNLLGNAAKFTENGRIELRVARNDLTPQALRGANIGRADVPLLRGEGELADSLPSPRRRGVGGEVTFAVSDTGIGMTEEQVGRLFQAFSQAEASTTRRFGGTGLGLALVQHFCQMMGGAISVMSTPGAGSTFTVTLPADAARDEARGTQTIVSSTNQNPGPDTPVVLVVDDDPAARELLTRHLESEGVRVVGASGGEEGLRLARQLRPSLVTLDVLMPGMDGWAVLGALKGDPATADIPVVVLTLLDDNDLGYALGAADYLTKPIERERLIAALRKHVGRHDGGAGQAGARRALVVEDDPATREMLRRMLQREGWAVDEAANGRIGLERVAHATPELILLDLMMPELDGFGFAERLRAEPAWRSIPVLVVTAKDLTPEERLRLNGWVEQVLQKGAYSRDELLAEVRALVRASVDRADSGRSERADDQTR